MTHTYQVTGMTCMNCEAKVKSSFLTLPDVTSVEVSKENSTATINMDKHIALSDLQNALGGATAKYQIKAIDHSETAEQAKSWLATYKPILLIFSYIILLTLLIQFSKTTFNSMQWMQHFMAGFFLTFSFFKMLDLPAFADSYSMYDIVAKYFKPWGYIYAFIELGLGLAYGTNFQPYLTSIITLVVMSISIVGVVQSVMKKQKIQCACLGAVFNLPMSTVTIIEDLLMISMSGVMLLIM